MKRPFKCPVCHGSGLVPMDYYKNIYETSIAINTHPQTCRSCLGTGIVWNDGFPGLPNSEEEL